MCRTARSHISESVQDYSAPPCCMTQVYNNVGVQFFPMLFSVDKLSTLYKAKKSTSFLIDCVGLGEEQLINLIFSQTFSLMTCHFFFLSLCVGSNVFSSRSSAACSFCL